MALLLPACGVGESSADGSDGGPSQTTTLSNIGRDTDNSEPGVDVDLDSRRPSSDNHQEEQEQEQEQEEEEEGDPAIGQADDGISATEAERTDVLTGDYDMLLHSPSNAVENEDCLVFELTAQNVGKQPDTYEFFSNAGSLNTGTAEPTKLSLDPGADGKVVVEVCDENVGSLTIQVFSDGLGDQLIGELELG